MNPMDNIRISPATAADEALPRIATKEEAYRKLRVPSGLMTHVVEHSDGTFSLRRHTWRDKCDLCPKKD